MCDAVLAEPGMAATAGAPSGPVAAAAAAAAAGEAPRVACSLSLVELGDLVVSADSMVAEVGAAALLSFSAGSYCKSILSRSLRCARSLSIAGESADLESFR